MGGTDYLTDMLFIASVCFKPVEFIPIIQTNDESINYLRSRLYFSRSELNTHSQKLEKTKIKCDNLAFCSKTLLQQRTVSPADWEKEEACLFPSHVQH